VISFTLLTNFKGGLPEFFQQNSRSSALEELLNLEIGGVIDDKDFDEFEDNYGLGGEATINDNDEYDLGIDYETFGESTIDSKELPVYFTSKDDFFDSLEIGDRESIDYTREKNSVNAVSSLPPGAKLVSVSSFTFDTVGSDSTSKDSNNYVPLPAGAKVLSTSSEVPNSKYSSWGTQRTQQLLQQLGKPPPTKDTSATRSQADDQDKKSTRDTPMAHNQTNRPPPGLVSVMPDQTHFPPPLFPPGLMTDQPIASPPPILPFDGRPPPIPIPGSPFPFQVPGHVTPMPMPTPIMGAGLPQPHYLGPPGPLSAPHYVMGPGGPVLVGPDGRPMGSKPSLYPRVSVPTNLEGSFNQSFAGDQRRDLHPNNHHGYRPQQWQSSHFSAARGAHGNSATASSWPRGPRGPSGILRFLICMSVLL